MAVPDHGDELNHVEEALQVRVKQHAGQRLNVQASAHIPLAADQAFQLIVHPQNEQIFRHLENCNCREVINDDGAGRLTVESEHVGRWRLLMFSGRVTTRLRIEQDHKAHTARFSLIPTRYNLLSHFQGMWAVDPAAGGCTLHLEQELQPRVFLLPPLGLLLKRIAAHQVRGIFADLQSEAERINAGKPTLKLRTK